jgi:hypothetical protein
LSSFVFVFIFLGGRGQTLADVLAHGGMFFGMNLGPLGTSALPLLLLRLDGSMLCAPLFVGCGRQGRFKLGSQRRLPVIEQTGLARVSREKDAPQFSNGAREVLGEVDFHGGLDSDAMQHGFQRVIALSPTRTVARCGASA